jgi:hypothetical protein
MNFEEHMKLERQVCALDLAKRLKELNVHQNSLFYYCYSKRTARHWISTKNEFEHYDKQEDFVILNYSAFTVAELGMLLPKDKIIKIKFFSSGNHGIIQNGHIEFLESTEADVRAKMLIYLIENNVVKI